MKYARTCVCVCVHRLYIWTHTASDTLILVMSQAGQAKLSRCLEMGLPFEEHCFETKDINAMMIAMEIFPKRAVDHGSHLDGVGPLELKGCKDGRILLRYCCLAAGKPKHPSLLSDNR